jgi:di/tricarboxylate transporter
LGLKLADDRKASEDLKSDEVGIVEAVISPHSRLIGRTSISMRLRTVYGLNLLALARQGRPLPERLGDTRFASGDVVMVQGPTEEMSETLGTLQLLPLAERDHGIGRPRRLILSTGIFAVAIILTIAGVLPVHIAFISAAVAMVLTNIVKADEAYEAIDWPVIVLLGAMLPVADAMLSTGAADSIARLLLEHLARGDAVLALVLLLLVTMFLSDLMNNAATAAVMCPIALSSAAQLAVSADAFLMAIAVGASCAFLTPIGHQNNTLILGPGGLRFGDFWRLGLAVEVIVVAVGVPMLLWVWPL